MQNHIFPWDVCFEWAISHWHVREWIYTGRQLLWLAGQPYHCSLLLCLTCMLENRIKKEEGKYRIFTRKKSSSSSGYWYLWQILPLGNIPKAIRKDCSCSWSSGPGRLWILFPLSMGMEVQWLLFPQGTCVSAGQELLLEKLCAWEVQSGGWTTTWHENGSGTVWPGRLVQAKSAWSCMLL